MRTAFHIALFLIFVSCSSSKKTQVKPATAASADASDEVTLFMSMERTACFGECPSYVISVNTDGTCSYDGYKWVDRVGKHTAVISKELMAEMKQQANEVGFFQMKDVYDGPVSDLPSIVIIFSTEKGVKRVIDRLEAPQELRSFEKYLDTVLLNLNWVSAE